MATVLDRDDIVCDLHPYIIRTGGKEDRWQYLSLFFLSAVLLTALIIWDLTTHTVLIKWTLMCAGATLYFLYLLIMRVKTQWTIDTDGIDYVRTSLVGGKRRFLAASDMVRIGAEKKESDGTATYTIVFHMRQGKPIRLENKHSLADVTRILNEIRPRLPNVPCA